MVDDSIAVVIDNGSATFKVGFAGIPQPESVFPSIVAHLTSPNNSNEIEQTILVGNDVYLSESIQAMKHPIESGIINNWTDLEQIWSHIFKNELRVLPEEHPVLITETPMNYKDSREKMVQILFEKFNVPHVYVAVSSVLSLYSTGRVTGTVIDCGNNKSYIVPIYDGYVIQQAVSHSNFAGNELTSYLESLLIKNGYNIDSIGGRTMVNDIKQKYGYVALDFDTEIKQTTRFNNSICHLPDGNVIDIGSERFRCPEALFNPPLLGLECSGIHHLTFKSIRHCLKDIQKIMYANMILAGGTSMFPGFAERLQKEVSNLTTTGKKKKVYPHEFGNNAAWIGGSILASLSSFNNMLISRKEFDEHGISIIGKKCF